jgi:hypothetical protein
MHGKLAATPQMKHRVGHIGASPLVAAGVVLVASCSPARGQPWTPIASGAAAVPDAGSPAADAGAGIVSSCQGTVADRGEVQVLGGTGDCFFVVNPAPATTDYTLELDTRLVDGPGFGIWIRGSYVDGSVAGLGVQYDPGAGGLKFVHYPDTAARVRFLDHACDKGWHHWELIGSVGTTRVRLDGVQVLDFSGGGVFGVQFGFRTWGGRFELRKLRVIEQGLR